MRIRVRDELVLIDVLVILLIIIIAFSQSSVFRAVFGLPFVIFFTGYTLTAVLFPGRSALGKIERITLGFAFSIAIVACVAFIINLALWGITLSSVLPSLTIFSLVMSIIAFFRQRSWLRKRERLLPSP